MSCRQPSESCRIPAASWLSNFVEVLQWNFVCERSKGVGRLRYSLLLEPWPCAVHSAPPFRQRSGDHANASSIACLQASAQPLQVPFQHLGKRCAQRSRSTTDPSLGPAVHLLAELVLQGTQGLLELAPRLLSHSPPRTV